MISWFPDIRSFQLTFFKKIEKHFLSRKSGNHLVSRQYMTGYTSFRDFLFARKSKEIILILVDKWYILEYGYRTLGYIKRHMVRETRFPCQPRCGIIIKYLLPISYGMPILFPSMGKQSRES